MVMVVVVVMVACPSFSVVDWKFGRLFDEDSVVVTVGQGGRV